LRFADAFNAGAVVITFQTDDTINCVGLTNGVGGTVTASGNTTSYIFATASTQETTADTTTTTTTTTTLRTFETVTGSVYTMEYEQPARWITAYDFSVRLGAQLNRKRDEDGDGTVDFTYEDMIPICLAHCDSFPECKGVYIRGNPQRLYCTALSDLGTTVFQASNDEFGRSWSRNL
jgi:hypothetical protein